MGFLLLLLLLGQRKRQEGGWPELNFSPVPLAAGPWPGSEALLGRQRENSQGARGCGIPWAHMCTIAHVCTGEKRGGHSEDSGGKNSYSSSQSQGESLGFSRANLTTSESLQKIQVIKSISSLQQSDPLAWRRDGRQNCQQASKEGRKRILQGKAKQAELFLDTL